MEDGATLEAIDDSLRHFKALSEALDERLRKREQQPQWYPSALRRAPGQNSSLGLASAVGQQGDISEAAASSRVQQLLAAIANNPQPHEKERVRFQSDPDIPSPAPSQLQRHGVTSSSSTRLSAPSVQSQSLSQPPTLSLNTSRSTIPASASTPAPAADYTSLLRNTLLTSPPSNASVAKPLSSSGGMVSSLTPLMSPARTPSGPGLSSASAAAPAVAAAITAALVPPVSPTTQIVLSTKPLMERMPSPAAAAAVMGSVGGNTGMLAGQVQYRALLAAAQAASRDGGARARAFHNEMEQIDAEIDAYVGNYKFEQYAPDAALAVQTAWRARSVRVFFNRYSSVRRKHLQRQLALVFGPLKQLVLAVLHARRRMLRRAFEEWRDWVWLGNDLFLKLVAKLRASIGSIKEHATPQQLWQLCTPPGGDPWTAKLTLGALVANVLIRQMPSRTLALYLAAWRRAVALQMAKRQKAAEVLRRMERKRFWEYVRLLFRFWFRWAIIQVSERMHIPPPIFRPRLPEWDAWLFKHTRSRELHSRMVQLHKGFRVRHFFHFWLFFTRRNKRMRQAWYSTAAHHIEAILRNAINAFKANLAEGRRLRRTKNAVFQSILHITRRNKTVRRIAKEVHEISLTAQRKLAFRRLREWSRANRMLCTAASIQIMARRSLCLIPVYAMLDDSTHLTFMWCWSAWRNYTLGRLRMRCLLGLHLSRANTVYAEIAFKALRKWAELQRTERARAALASLQPLLPSVLSAPNSPYPQALSLRPLTTTTLMLAPPGLPLTQLPDGHLPASLPGGRISDAGTSEFLGTGTRLQPGSPGPTHPGIGTSAGEAAAIAAAVSHHSGVVVFRSASINGSPGPTLSGDVIGHTSTAGTVGPSASAAPSPVPPPSPGPRAGAGGGGGGGINAENGGEYQDGAYELFVSLADYPLPSGGSWHSPLDKQELMRRVWNGVPPAPGSLAAAAAAAATQQGGDTTITGSVSGGMGMTPADMGMPTGATLAKMREAVQQLVELDGPFGVEVGERRVILNVARLRELTAAQKSWVDVDNPVSAIFLSQGRPDPGLWQRLVGLMACDVPHPDNPGAHLVDQARLPLAKDAAAVRRAAYLSRLNLQPAEAAAGDTRRTSSPSTSPPASSAMSPKTPSEGGAAIMHVAAGGDGPAPGILLHPDDEDTMLLHRLCEAEDFLDTCLHVLLGAGSGETMLLRHVIAGRVPAGTLLGDALTSLLQPALRVDLATMSAMLRHRTNRDRVITLGVDLADKARMYAVHRPEFTLTKRDRRGGAVNAAGGAAARAAAAAAAIAARITGSTVPAASVTPELGVSPLSPMQIAISSAVSSGPTAAGNESNGDGADARASGGSAAKLGGTTTEEDEDMDSLRVARRLAAVAQAEAVATAAKVAASAALAAHNTTISTPPPTAETLPLMATPGASPSRRWRPVKSAGLSKSAVIRMEMLTGRSVGTTPGGLSPPNSAGIGMPPATGGSATSTAAAPASGSTSAPRSNLASRIGGSGPSRSAVSSSPSRGSRTIGFSVADGTSPPGGQRSPSLASNSPERRTSPVGRRSQQQLRRQRSSTVGLWSRGGSGNLPSARSLIAESSSFSFIVRSSNSNLDLDHEQQGGGSRLMSINESMDADGGPVSPERTRSVETPPALVNNFLYLTPPGFLSAGKVLNPANFPWPRDVPTQASLQSKADFILRAALPNLNALPQLPDIVFGPLGDPQGSQGLSPETSSILSYASAVSAWHAAGGATEGGMGSPAPSEYASGAFAGATGTAAAAAATGNASWSISGEPTGGGDTSISGGPVTSQLAALASARSNASLTMSRPPLMRGAASFKGSLPTGGGESGGRGVRRMGSNRAPRSLYGSSSLNMDREALANAVTVRRERRTQAMLQQLMGYDVLQDGLDVVTAPGGTTGGRLDALMMLEGGPLPGVAEGADGEEGDEDEAMAAAARVATAVNKAAAAAKRATRLRGTAAADILGMTFKAAKGKLQGKSSSNSLSLAGVFSSFGVKRDSEGDIGSDVESAAGTPRGAGTPRSTDTSDPTRGALVRLSESTQEADEGTACPSPKTPERASGSGGVRNPPRPLFRVTPHQLNIFMGGHLRRASNMVRAASKCVRDCHGNIISISGKPRKGLTLTADGILVTPYGVQVIREMEGEGVEADPDAGEQAGGRPSMDSAISAADGTDADRTSLTTPPLDAGLCRSKTIILHEFPNAMPFEAMYDFHNNVWLPPEQRTNMLDDYDLQAVLAAGDLDLSQMWRFITPPPDSPFLQEFMQELERTRAGAQQKTPPTAVDRQHAWSRLSRGVSVIMSRGSITGSAAGLAPPSNHPESVDSAPMLSPSRRRRRGTSKFGRNRYPISESAFLSDGSVEGGSRQGTAPSTFMDDLFDEDFGVNISAAAAVAAASTAVAVKKDNVTINQLERMAAPGFLMPKLPDGVAPWRPQRVSAVEEVAKTEEPATLASEPIGGSRVSSYTFGKTGAKPSTARHTVAGWGHSFSKPTTARHSTSRATTSRMSRSFSFLSKPSFARSGASHSSFTSTKAQREPSLLKPAQPNNASTTAATTTDAFSAASAHAVRMQRTLALQAVTGGNVYGIDVNDLPDAAEAAELLRGMFTTAGGQPKRPDSVRPRSHHHRHRKVGNLRTALPALADPLLEAVSPPGPPPGPQQLPSGADVVPGTVSEGAASPGGGELLSADSVAPSGAGSGGVTGAEEDAQSEPSACFSDMEAGSASSTSLRGEVTLAGIAGGSPRSPRRGAGGAETAAQRAAAAAEALLWEEGVRRQLEALRAMWSSDPYSARPGVDPEFLPPPPPNLAAAAAVAAGRSTHSSNITDATITTVSGASLSGTPSKQQQQQDQQPSRDQDTVRIGAGLARALSEARAEQWVLFDKSLEHMATEFARAMRQLGAVVEEEDDGSDGDGKGGLYTTRSNSGYFAGPVPGSMAGSRNPSGRFATGGGAAGARRLPRRPASSPGMRHDRMGGWDLSKPGTPLTRRSTRGLLDALEETLASCLDPTTLTGLNVKSYGQRLSELMRRLVVAPASSKYMFWRKVQTVQQLRQRLMEDRSMAAQLRSITWTGAFNGHEMSPPGTDSRGGRKGPFAAEAMAHRAARAAWQRRIAHYRRSRLRRERRLGMQHRAALLRQRALELLEQQANGAAVGEAAAVAAAAAEAAAAELAALGGAGMDSMASEFRSRSAGGLIGRRAAWSPLVIPGPPAPGTGASVQHNVSEQIVRPARLQPQPVPTALTASSRDVRPRQMWVRRRRWGVRSELVGGRRPSTGTLMSSTGRLSRLGFRDTLMSVDPNDLNRVLDYQDGVLHLDPAAASVAAGRSLWCAVATAGGKVCSRGVPGRGGPRRRFNSYVSFKVGSDEDEEEEDYEESTEEDEDDEDEDEDGDGDDEGGEGDGEHGRQHLHGGREGELDRRVGERLAGLVGRAGDEAARRPSLLADSEDEFGGWRSTARSQAGFPWGMHKHGASTAVAAAGMEAVGSGRGDASGGQRSDGGGGGSTGGSKSAAWRQAPSYMASTVSATKRASAAVALRATHSGAASEGGAAGVADGVTRLSLEQEPSADGGGEVAEQQDADGATTYLNAMSINGTAEAYDDGTQRPDVYAAAVHEAEAATGQKQQPAPTTQQLQGQQTQQHSQQQQQQQLQQQQHSQQQQQQGLQKQQHSQQRRPRRQSRPRLTAAKLQVALAQRAALRAALEARGELLELDEMDLEELEEEADLVDRLVEASIRVYSHAMAQRAARIDGTAAAAGGAVAVPGDEIRIPGRGRALGWTLPGPMAMERGEGMALLPDDPWHYPASGTAAAKRVAAAAASSGIGSPPRLRGNKLPASTDDMDSHLPHPCGQLRPVVRPAVPLAPISTPRPFPAAQVQPGNVRFPSRPQPQPQPQRPDSAPSSAPFTALSLRPLLRSPVSGAAKLRPLTASAETTTHTTLTDPRGSHSPLDSSNLLALQNSIQTGPKPLSPHRLQEAPGSHLLAIPLRAVSPGSRGATATPLTSISMSSGQQFSIPAHSRTQLDPILDPPRPRPRSADSTGATGAAGAAGATASGSKPGSAGNGGLPALPSARPHLSSLVLKAPSSPPAAGGVVTTPTIDWIRANSPASGLVGLVSIGTTPSVAAAAVAAGPPPGITGMAAPLEPAPTRRSGRSSSYYMPGDSSGDEKSARSSRAHLKPLVPRAPRPARKSGTEGRVNAVELAREAKPQEVAKALLDAVVAAMAKAAASDAVMDRRAVGGRSRKGTEAGALAQGQGGGKVQGPRDIEDARGKPGAEERATTPEEKKGEKR